MLPEDFTRALDQCAADGNGVPEKPTLAARARRATGLLVRAQAMLGVGCLEMGHMIAGKCRDDLPVSKLAAEIAHHAAVEPLSEVAARIDGVDGEDGIEALLPSRW